MNRFRSSSLLIPASLLLLLGSSCKGTSDEAQAAEPLTFPWDSESTPAESEPVEEPASVPEPATTPQPEPEPEAPAPPAAESPAPPPAAGSQPAAPEPEPEPEPAPEPKRTLPAWSSSTTTPAPTTPSRKTVSSEPRQSSAGQELEAALAKGNEWGVDPYVRAREARLPRVRDNYVFLMGGARSFSEDIWNDADVDTVGTGGINYMGRGPGGWFHWDLAFSWGSDNSSVSDGTNFVEVDTTVGEFDFGLVKMFSIGPVLRPYIGLGGTYMRVGAQIPTASGVVNDTSYSIGAYGRVGLALQITDWGGMVGIDARYVGGTSIDLGSIDTNADGLVGSITLGFSW